MQTLIIEGARNGLVNTGFRPGAALTMPGLLRSVRTIGFIPTPPFGGG